MKVISRKDHKLIANLIVDGAYKYVSKFAIEDDEGNRIAEYDSIETLYREFKDYEKPERYYYIDRDGRVVETQNTRFLKGLNKKIYDRELAMSIGNYFETKEEADKAVEKLKAWKRLKEQGFKFKSYQRSPQGTYDIYANWEDYIPPLSCMIDKDLDLLFGGEE